MTITKAKIKKLEQALGATEELLYIWQDKDGYYYKGNKYSKLDELKRLNGIGDNTIALIIYQWGNYKDDNKGKD